MSNNDSDWVSQVLGVILALAILVMLILNTGCGRMSDEEVASVAVTQCLLFVAATEEAGCPVGMRYVEEVCLAQADLVCDDWLVDWSCLAEHACEHEPPCFEVRACSACVGSFCYH